MLIARRLSNVLSFKLAEVPDYFTVILHEYFHDNIYKDNFVENSVQLLLFTNISLCYPHYGLVYYWSSKASSWLQYNTVYHNSFDILIIVAPLTSSHCLILIVTINTRQ